MNCFCFFFSSITKVAVWEGLKKGLLDPWSKWITCSVLDLHRTVQVDSH